MKAYWLFTVAAREGGKHAVELMDLYLFRMVSDNLISNLGLLSKVCAVEISHKYHSKSQFLVEKQSKCKVIPLK